MNSESYQARRYGGTAVREKSGRDFYAQSGAKGGKTAPERHRADFYSTTGKQGGTTTRQRLGVEHYMSALVGWAGCGCASASETTKRVIKRRKLGVSWSIICGR